MHVSRVGNKIAQMVGGHERDFRSSWHLHQVDIHMQNRRMSFCHGKLQATLQGLFYFHTGVLNIGLPVLASKNPHGLMFINASAKSVIPDLHLQTPGVLSSLRRLY